MGLNQEQVSERANATKDIKTFTRDDNQPYFFVSYKSDNWKIVLDEIIRKLVNDYGLRI